MENAGYSCHRAIFINISKKSHEKVWIFIQLGLHKSSLQPITCDVPQGVCIRAIPISPIQPSSFLSPLSSLLITLYILQANRDISELCNIVNRAPSLVASSFNGN